MSTVRVLLRLVAEERAIGNSGRRSQGRDAGVTSAPLAPAIHMPGREGIPSRWRRGSLSAPTDLRPWLRGGAVWA